MYQRLLQSTTTALINGVEKPRRFRTEGGLNEHLGPHETATGPKRGRLLAKVISPCEKKKPEGISLTEQAAVLKESCPDPKQVVEGFLEDLSPSSWSGSRADTIAERVTSMSNLLKHGNESVREATTYFIEKAIEIEKTERDWKEQHNGDDPSFEKIL